MSKTVIYKNFEPERQFAKALSLGTQVSSNELLAYDLACDYYGKERVALQLDTVEVVYHNTTTPETRLEEAEYCCKTIHTEDMDTPQKLMRQTAIMHRLGHSFQSIYALFIHWPEARVTNENDKHIDIKDLFARIPLSIHGTTFHEESKITFMRTTYTRVQWNNNYMHSHVDGIYSNNPFKFMCVCLGTGPIKNTIRTLSENPENEEALMLLFWELDKVVHVESLKGIPYMRLEHVTKNRIEPITDLKTQSVSPYRNLSSLDSVKVFLKSFFKAVEVPLVFQNGKYVLGCSFLDFQIMVTNYYNKWIDAFNEASSYNVHPRGIYPSDIAILDKYIVKDRTLCTKDGNTSDRDVPPVEPFKFNNESYPLVVLEDTTNKNYLEYNLVTPSYVVTILEFILKSINTATSYNYEERKERKEGKEREKDARDESILTTVNHSRNTIRRFNDYAICTQDTKCFD